MAADTAPAVTVTIDADDFAVLPSVSMAWREHDWVAQRDRFEPFIGSTPIAWEKRWAYWFTDAPSMVLARAYLRGIGADHQVLTDMADDSPYVIITDYRPDLVTADEMAPWAALAETTDGPALVLHCLCGVQCVTSVDGPPLHGRTVVAGFVSLHSHPGHGPVLAEAAGGAR